MAGGKRRNKGGAQERLYEATRQDETDQRFGFELIGDAEHRTGWLLNMATCSVHDEISDIERTGLCLYFLGQEGCSFKAKVTYPPYFYIATKEGCELEVDAILRRHFSERIASSEIQDKEDLDKPNHLAGIQQRYIKLSFYTVQGLMEVRRELMPIVNNNKDKRSSVPYQDAREESEGNKENVPPSSSKLHEQLSTVVDIREHDVPYHMRYCIDNDIRCGKWYNVMERHGDIELHERSDLMANGDVLVCAFDIETTKFPLQLPNSDYDRIFMISYMMDGEGFLISNREIVSEAIDDFEYTPKPEFPGPFTVFNEPDEKALLQRFFSHMRERQPGIYVTFNGDSFDFPFVENRAKAHSLSMLHEIGLECDTSGECHSRSLVHMDALAWVNRDSYLPQGSRGLKAVTKAKLGFNPVEIEPEKMQPFAQEKPQEMAAYSVSDALCTYYLYLKYVHPFIFALCTIVPLSPDEVLRKGTGTLCEALLMVQAFKGNIICPNKATAPGERWYNNRLLESETYIGGHVEALESGIYRADLETHFNCQPTAYDELISQLDEDLYYGIAVEQGIDMNEITDYEEVKGRIRSSLEDLRNRPSRMEKPLIYHLDVSAMYPNIILTNRLQPSSIVNDEICASCVHNKPGENCLRQMEWKWRGQMHAARKSDYITVRNQLQAERFPAVTDGGPLRNYDQLGEEEKEGYLKKRLQAYTQSVYKRVHEPPVTETRTANVCMRENPFYVNTVRDFRNRRYEYKGNVKEWKKKYAEAKESGNALQVKEAEDMWVLYDSLQLAHKCILNSFYGYVMRKGSRWYSMEMAGVVTHSGAQLIQRARELVERVGTPLELDTDGIWCMLPSSFPEMFTFTLKNGRKVKVNYPCIVLNHMVSRNNRNDQYQEWDSQLGKYTTSSAMTIEFEVDGPYKAMVLPAAQEEGKAIKKRYAVFTFENELAELKGFEMKRRGELKLIKEFQTEVFDYFLEGETLEGAYKSVASIADRWLDMLDNQGADLSDEELLEYISESSMMSKSMEEYGDRKSCAMTTARRLAELLGREFIKDKGLNCQYVVAAKPETAPVSERAIPTAVFQTEPSISRRFLREWTKETISGEPSEAPDMRSFLDWEYYKSRLGNAIQKIITIPAALQKVPNPVPRVEHPEWIGRRVAEKEDQRKQRKLDDMFKHFENSAGTHAMKNAIASQDLEDTAGPKRKQSSIQRIARANHLEKRSKKKAGRSTSQSEEVSNDGAMYCTGELDTPGKPPDKREDFQGWLRFYKKRWREFREQRREQRAAVGGRANLPQNGIQAMLRRQEKEALSSDLHVVQTVPTNTPGEFVMWAMIGRQMYAIPLQVHRKIFINQRSPDVGAGKVSTNKQRVNRLLPHGRQPMYLYEMIISEKDFKSQGGVVQALSSSADVEGLYESNVPLEMEAEIQLGCTTALQKDAKQISLASGFALNELNMKPSSSPTYLTSTENEKPILWHVGVFLAIAQDGKRGICVIYMPGRGVVGIILLCDEHVDLHEGHAETIWEQAAHRVGEDHMASADELDFTVQIQLQRQDFFATVHMHVNEYLSGNHGPSMIVWESNVAADDVLGSAIAVRRLPVLSVPFYTPDSNFPVGNWKLPALKMATARCGALGKWIQQRIQISKWAQIAIGNLNADWLLQSADIFFARALRADQQLLWAGWNGVPDLGIGHEPQMEARLMASILDSNECTSLDSSQASSLPVEVCNPGAYRTICVELRLEHLAVCAIDNASYLDEMEEFGLLGDQSGSNSLAGTEQAAAHAFKVLQNIMASWLKAAVEEHNKQADALLYHLHRWLASPSSRLHDPALLHLVRLCMRKIFSLFLAEIKKLGAYIVRADFGAVWLCTGKATPAEAFPYVDFLRKTLGNRKLFRWLSLTPQRYWHCLLFRDKYNFSSIEMDVNDPCTTASEAADVKLTADWDIAGFLPPVLKPHFEAVVSEFLFRPWEQELSAMDTKEDDPMQKHAIDEQAVCAHVDSLVRGQLTEKLLRMVQDIEKHLTQGQDAPREHVFPKRAGSHLPAKQLGSPALAFAKFVYYVLSLDYRCENAVKLLRKNMLKALHVHEFAQEAEFKEPCITYVLQGVICSYCNDCRDIDLCRDQEVNNADLPLAERWRCINPSCRQLYDLDAMERMLIARVKWRARSYQLQDLRCQRCRYVKAAHVASICECGGSFELTVSAESLHQWSCIFVRIGEFHGFELLRQTAAWLSQHHEQNRVG